MLRQHDITDSQPTFGGAGNLSASSALRVLIVDDNALSRKLVSATLTKVATVLDMASGGQEALALIALRMPYDVILMDCHMPDMDGAEVTSRIRSLADERKAKTPIIGLTADMRLRARDTLIGAGMNEVVAKPLNVDVLKTLLPH
jgi:CheY-like chemotaxis protein